MSENKLRVIKGSIDIQDSNSEKIEKLKSYNSSCIIFDVSNGLYFGTDDQNSAEVEGFIEPIGEGELYAMFANLAVSGAPIEEALIDDTEE